MTNEATPLFLLIGFTRVLFDKDRSLTYLLLSVGADSESSSETLVYIKNKMQLTDAFSLDSRSIYENLTTRLGKSISLNVIIELDVFSSLQLEQFEQLKQIKKDNSKK